MFIPTWRHFPVLLVAGHSWTRQSPLRGDHISLFTPRAHGMSQLQTGLSKPLGPRATAAICEGRGLQGRQSGRRGSQQLLGAAFGMEPPRHPLPGARSCRESNCKADLCRTDAIPSSQRQWPVQEEFMLSHCRKMRNTLQDFTERLCERGEQSDNQRLRHCNRTCDCH